MSSIKTFLLFAFYRLVFQLRLRKILREHRQEVVRAFDIQQPKDSYWIDYSCHKLRSPQKLDEEVELHGSIGDQAKAVLQYWHFFVTPQKDFLELIKFVVLLREKHRQGKLIQAHDDSVSDHIYEM